MPSEQSRPSQNFISAIKAKKAIRKGYEAFLAYVVDTQNEGIALHEILVVREFLDVFLDELIGLPPDRKIEFEINLILGIGSISKPPYRMAPIELREMKIQLQKFLDKQFIHPSISP